MLGVKFKAWLQEEGLSPASQKVYRAMWNKLDRYCKERGLDLRPDTLGQFLAANRLSSTQAKRYIMIATKVTGIEEMRDVAKHYQGAPRALPVAIRPQQGEQLFQGEAPTTGNWKHVRDGALLRVMYGAGLKMSEALVAEVSDFHFEGNVGVIEVRGEKARMAPMIPGVVAYVRQWITARSKMPFASNLAFPASLAGEALNPSTVYRMTRKHLEIHGINKRHLGTGLLRNTFAVRQLENEMPVEAVQDWIGHQRRESTESLLRLVANRHGVMPR
jgi:site-specific recombinase XerD